MVKKIVSYILIFILIILLTSSIILAVASETLLNEELSPKLKLIFLLSIYQNKIRLNNNLNNNKIKEVMIMSLPVF